MSYVRSFLIGLAVGFVPVVLLLVVAGGEVAGALSIFGMALGIPAIGSGWSSLRASDREEARSLRRRALLYGGIAIGCFPLVIASSIAVCALAPRAGVCQ